MRAALLAAAAVGASVLPSQPPASAASTPRDGPHAEAPEPAAAELKGHPKEPAIRLTQETRPSPTVRGQAPKRPPTATPGQPPKTAKDFTIKPAPALAPGPRYYRLIDPKLRKVVPPAPSEELSPAVQLQLRRQINLTQHTLNLNLRGIDLPATVSPEEIADLRLPVDLTELRALPFSAIAHIVTYFGATEAPEQGTGFLIEPGIAVTAAHVLHSPRSGPATGTAFTPGCLAEGIAAGPNPKYSIRVEAARLRVPEAWTQGDFGEENDYGVIFLPPGHGTEPCGHLTLDNAEAQFLERRASYEAANYLVAGYPYEKAYGSLWFARGSLKSVGELVVRHLVDTTPGQSGSPLFAVGLDRATDQKIPIVFGIHSRAGYGPFNIARRIDAQLLRDLKRWKAQFKGAAAGSQ